MSGGIVYKMTGSGNDFLFVDGRRHSLQEWPAERIRRLCHRRLSLGADGLVVLEPGGGPGAVRFHFFNSDGGRAAMCGNAALCATRLAAWLGIAPAAGMRLETDAAAYEARCLDDGGQRAEIGLGDVERVDVPDIPLAAGEEAIAFATVGVPHLVVVVSDTTTVDLPKRGRELRYHQALGPAGANVNFVSLAPGEWVMRTYERGVESETLACGTGAVASAAFLGATGRARLPLSVKTASGSILTVSGSLGGESGAAGASKAVLTGALLAGEGRLVFRAVLVSE